MPEYSKLAEQLFQLFTLSPVAENALRLHDAGLTVFPLPYKCKAHSDIPGAAGFKHSLFDRTRLLREDIPRAFAGLCNIAVKCSNGLFVFDCETRESAEETLYQFTQNGIPLYGWWTLRGAHILLRAARPVKSERANKTTTLPDIEIVGEGGYVVSAGSLHPKGKVYEWFSNCAERPPELDVKQLHWLYDTQDRAYQIKTAAAQPGTLARKYFVYGGKVVEGERNTSLFNAGVDARNAGYSRGSANRLAIPARQSGLSDSEIKRTLDSVFTQSPHTKKVERIDSLYHFAATFQWQGRTGKTDRRVFEALIERYQLTPYATGQTGIRGSVRELAELTRLDKSTVRSALRRLTGKDGKQIYQDFVPVSVAVTGHRHVPQTYRFNSICWRRTRSDEIRTLAHSAKEMPIVYENCHQSILFETGALGYTGSIIYNVLLKQSYPVTVREIAQITGFTPRQVRYALRSNGFGIQSGLIAVQHGKILKYTGVAMTERQIEACLPMHIREKPEKRRNRHRKERSIYACVQVLRWREQFDTYYPQNGVSPPPAVIQLSIPVEKSAEVVT
jgi:predicted transcriptional regulator